MALTGKKQEILNLAAEMGGGALAGYLEGRYPDKKVVGLSLGAVAAAAGIAIDLAGIGPSKLRHYAGEAGGGAAAYVIGRMVNEKTKKQVAQTANSPIALRSGVRGVGALPEGRKVVTASELRQSLASFAG